MNQKITISLILRRSVLAICAVFCFAAFFSCSDDYAPLPTLSDVFASDVSIVYDGNPHTVTVVNTLPSDTVTYSMDNILFSSSCPSFSDVGSYTVYFKVLRYGYEEFSSSATVSISPCILSGISASDLSFVYDGLSHSVIIDGVLSSDNILYSTDGISFSSSAPSFSDVGFYTVYYRVERPYGDYKSSCSVTILPNIYGRYFNPDYGVVEISSDTSFLVSGSGYINYLPFSVSDGILTYDSVSYSLLSDDDYIYRLSASDSSVFFRSSSSGSLSISFKDDVAEIGLGDCTLLSLPHFNYCESGVISDYTNLCFTQAFSSTSSSIVTDISVELSLRTVNPVTVDDTYYVTYDGLSHEFEFTCDVVYLDDIHSFTDVGSHTVSVIFTSSVYLPKLLDCTLVILPNIDGVFVSSEHIIQISDGSISIDGMPSADLVVLSDSWAWNDLPITVTDGGIVYDDTVYSSVSSAVLAIYIDDVYYSYLLVSSDMLFIYVSYENSVLSFTDGNDNLLLSIPLSCDGISISLNDRPLAPFDLPFSFIIGFSNLSSGVGIVSVSTERQN